MANSPSNSMAKPQGRCPRDSPGSTSRWVSLKHTSDARGPTEYGLEDSPYTSRHEESRASTTDTEHLESSVLRESRSKPMPTSTSVFTDSKILEHFDQMRILISGFLQQKSDRQSFFDYVASEAEKMTQEEFEDLKGRIFRDIEAVKNTHKRQPLHKRSATITRESQKVGILPTTTQQASSSAGNSYVYYTPSFGFGNPQLTVS